MARDEQARESDRTDELLDRRSYLKLAGLAATATAGASVACRSVDAVTTLDASDGELIDPYLENISDGETIHIPQGTYTFRGATISADDWTVDGRGSTFDVQGKVNLTLRGQNWSFGGVNLDVGGADQVRAYPRGGPWRFHHVAWNGKNTAAQSLIQPEVNVDGAEGVIDSVSLGSGTGIDPATGEY